MGKIADAIEQVECDLEEALEAIADLKKENQDLEEERDYYKDTTQDLSKYIQWAEDFYPEMANQYEAIQKVRG